MIVLAVFVPCVALGQSGPLPTVTPIAVQPIGPASGGGVLTRVTYEMRMAEAANAVPSAAANAATYTTRAVTIAGSTMGGIVRGVVAGGARLAPWVDAALTAYELYKWYQDRNTGALMSPGTTVASSPCAQGGPYWAGGFRSGEIACSLPGLQRVIESDYRSSMANSIWGVDKVTCSYTGGGTTRATCIASLRMKSDPSVTGEQLVDNPEYKQGAPANTVDPSYNVDPSPVSDKQLGDVAQDHPEWWPDMLRDPQTGQPLVTPEIADDMTDLKKQLAPRYGVDPQTVPQTQPDPDYQSGKAQPREQSLPGYCAWASAACDYYKFVQDQWPDKQHKIDPDNGCSSPMPACSGDAVLCSIAANTRAMKCKAGGDDDPPDNNPGSRKVQELIQPDIDLGDTSRLDTSGFGWGTACPFNDLQVELGGQTVSVSVKPVCDYGPWMRAFILILAGLQSARIVAGLKDADGA